MANVGLRVGIIAVIVLGLGSILGAPLTDAAQNENQRQPWVHLSIVQVNPAMVNEFISVQRELMDRARNGDTPWRTVSRTAVFGDNYRFLIARPGESLAGFNDTGEADAELTSLVNRLEKCITSRKSYAIRILGDLDNPLPEDEEPGVMVVNLSKVAPGRDQEYYDLMESDFLPHFNEAEMHHMTGSLALGGEGGYIHLFYLDNFRNLDQGSPVLQALGPAGAQEINTKLAGIVISTEQWIVRLLPDLSYGPWSPEEGTKAEGREREESKGLPTAAAEGAVNSMTGCFNKGDMNGYYVLTDKDSGEETIVTGIRALERHSTNHEVAVIGTITKEGDREVFKATEIRHVAATCSNL